MLSHARIRTYFIGAAAAGLALAGCSEAAGNGSPGSGGLLYGQPCVDHPDNVLDSGGFSGRTPLAHELVGEEAILENFSEKFYQADKGYYGFGDVEVRLSPEQIQDIQAGVEQIQQDIIDNGINNEGDPGNWRINVLNEDGVQRITDEGYIDGDMCVDAGEGSGKKNNNTKLKNYE